MYKPVEASVIVGLRLCSVCLVSLTSSDYEEMGIGFNIFKNLKMNLYSQINPISHLKHHSSCHCNFNVTNHLLTMEEIGLPVETTN